MTTEYSFKAVVGHTIPENELQRILDQCLVSDEDVPFELHGTYDAGGFDKVYRVNDECKVYAYDEIDCLLLDLMGVDREDPLIGIAFIILPETVDACKVTIYLKSTPDIDLEGDLKDTDDEFDHQNSGYCSSELYVSEDFELPTIEQCDILKRALESIGVVSIGKPKIIHIFGVG